MKKLKDVLSNISIKIILLKMNHSDKFSNLFDVSDFSDIRLRSNDKKIINAHKLILSQESQYFKTMFLSEFKKEDIIDFDFSYDVLYSCIKCLYYGEMKINNYTDVIEYIKFANFISHVKLENSLIDCIETNKIKDFKEITFIKSELELIKSINEDKIGEKIKELCCESKVAYEHVKLQECFDILNNSGGVKCEIDFVYSPEMNQKILNFVDMEYDISKIINENKISLKETKIYFIPQKLNKIRTCLFLSSVYYIDFHIIDEYKFKKNKYKYTCFKINKSTTQNFKYQEGTYFKDNEYYFRFFFPKISYDTLVKYIKYDNSRASKNFI